MPLHPGDLVQFDTIHYLPFWYRDNKTKWYIYTAIDIHSRTAYAEVFPKATCGTTLKFYRNAQKYFGFDINCAQTDHGPEFGRYFRLNIKARHRFIRVRKPNDNAHLERFNRTIQEECVSKHLPTTIEELNKWIKKYLKYYNNERLHMGIDYQTPSQKLAQVFPRS